MAFNIQKQNHKTFDLIIFDCDGTLVDSEFLNNKVSSDLLVEFGLSEYTPQRCMEEFAGVSWQEIKKILEKRHNLEIPRSLIDNYVTRVDEVMPQYLKKIEGMLGFVKQCAQITKIAVGSNGMRSNVMRSLELSGYMDCFTDSTIFTKIQVANPKPAPDLFLFAAKEMGVNPARCLVIEDSPTGVRAGKAAGMEVWGFTMTFHEPEIQKEKLIQAGAHDVFQNIIHMQAMLGL